MKRFFSASALALIAVLGAVSAAQAQSCTYHILARYHYTDEIGSDHACVVFQRTDCGVTTMCAG
jgi:hypothetical protein